MAVVTESFSIREYTERMRNVDLRRCWPFGVGREDALSLPSISVRRFKWWSDELDTARSEVGVEEEHGLENQAVAEAISEADDILPTLSTGMEAPVGLTAGEDGKRIGKGKQKTPKKRSMVELFAAAPLIAGAVDDDEADSEGECGEEEGEGGGRDVIPEEEGEMDVAMRKKTGIKEINVKKKKGRKKRKKKGISEGLKLDIRASKKEKIRKPKIISSLQSYMFKHPLCSKNNRKTAGNFMEIQKKTRKAKSVRKHKVLQTLKKKSMNKEVAKKLPVRSILKNQKKSSKIVNAKAANLIKLYCRSNKHVTFSVEDDILGSSRACSSMDFPQMQNLCKIFSDVLAASSAINHSSKGYDQVDTKEKPQNVNSSENETHKTEVSSTDYKDQSTNVNSSNSSCSGTEKASFAVMVDLNRTIEANEFDDFIPATSTLSSSCTYSGDPARRGTHEKNQNSASEILLKAGLPLTPEQIVLSAPRDNFVASSDATSSLTLLKDNERHCQPRVDSGIKFYRPIEDHQSSKGLLSSICYSMGSKKLGEPLFSPDSVSACKSKCPGEEFIGLPLNSQGELIQFHSGTKLNEAYKKQNIDLGSNSRKNHSEITNKKVSAAASYQKNYYSTKERVRHWLNFDELDGSKRMGVQRTEPIKGNDRFLRRNSSPKIHEYRHGPDLPAKCKFDYHAQPAAQPTMRLMGKNVVVGGMSREFPAFNDRRTSNNTEKFTGQTRFSMFPDKSLPQQWMQREDVTHAAIGRSKGNPIQLANSTPKFHQMNSFDPSFDYMHTHQPQWLSGISDNHLFNGDVEKHMLHCQAFSNNPTQFLGNYVSGEASISTEHHYPSVVPSRLQNIHQNILMSSPHCRQNQRLFRGELATPKPQFENEDFEKISQPPFVQPTAKLPQWLLNAKQQKRNQIPDSHYSHLSSHLTSGHVKKNISTKKRDMNGIYSNFSCFKAPIDPRKLGKRPAEFDDGLVNPAKRPLKGKEISLNFQQTTTGNCAYGNATGPSSSRFDDDLRSGPIKLIGGAKHILKPCQRIDDQKCRPIHSTIIFPGNAASFGTEKKFSNIYKF